MNKSIRTLLRVLTNDMKTFLNITLLERMMFGSLHDS